MHTNDLVFISYAREDRAWAEKLYMDLRRQEINAWLDVRNLKAGANWKKEVQKAIRSARYFILLLSKHSITKRGFVQREIKEALETLKEFPTGEIFLIPARLDETEPVDQELRDLNWVALLPDYHHGLARILSSLGTLEPAPLIFSGAGAPTLPVQVVDKGRIIEVEMPMTLGERAAVSYAPFRTSKEFIQQFMDRLPHSTSFTDTSLSYYITVNTQYPGVMLGDDLHERYPGTIVLVLQNAFSDLQVRTEGFSIQLYFGGLKRLIAIPYGSILRIRIPQAGLSIDVEEPQEM